MLRGGLARWSDSLTGYTAADYTFIDLGCGKGRAIMLASEVAFAGILGVELNPALVAIARNNLAIWSKSKTPHSCQNLEVLNDDALAFPIPETPVLLYLFNPFDAVVVGQLADRIATLLPNRRHPIDLLYARPEHIEPFEGLPGVQILWKGEVPFTPEDIAADIFDTTQQQVFVYRVPPRRA
jgi:SAM-dependent methyltransferase